MAIIWRNNGHDIRERGISGVNSARLNASGIKLQGVQDTLAKVEARKKADLDVDLPDHVTFLHIFSLNPLNYILRVAPAGHVPDKNWWEPPSPRLT